MALKDDAYELKGILGEIQAAMDGMNERGKSISDGFSSSKEALEGLISVAQKYQSDSSKLSEAFLLFILSDITIVNSPFKFSSNCSNSSISALINSS